MLIISVALVPTYAQTNRPVRIATPLGDNVLLVKSLTGGERLGRPFQYELVLYSETHDLDYKDRGAERHDRCGETEGR